MELQILENPWKTWLLQTDLYVAESNVGVIVVGNGLETSVYTSLEVLTRAYPIAKKVYPQLQSLIILSGDIYSALEENILEIHNITIGAKD